MFQSTEVTGSSLSLWGHRAHASQSEHDSLVYHMSEDSGLGRATPHGAPPPPAWPDTSPPPPAPARCPPDSSPSDATEALMIMPVTSPPPPAPLWTSMVGLGPRLYKQPAAKSNRTIILNAVEYCVFPGVVNQANKHRVLEEVARSESKHFLILFRDAGCQYRAIYTFNPETEEVYKLYGTGPKMVNDRMFERFFKYNSGGKCFSQIHTKHLTVTIDAFTIHNSLWQGKRVNLPLKKDMTLVI
ncbi:Patronin [Chionoecetes opilio]|uniref:Patronin n=1 Tax=Chionoecetes opilio TaxID=41210 RepID=A0A8J5CNN4_CHIOP|nr:Patronin [Chionoecetes opilio]